MMKTMLLTLIISLRFKSNLRSGSQQSYSAHGKLMTMSCHLVMKLLVAGYGFPRGRDHAYLVDRNSDSSSLVAFSTVR